MRVGRRGEGEIGQRENGAALDGLEGIPMMRMQCHFGCGMTGSNRQQLDVRAIGELVVPKILLDEFHGNPRIAGLRRRPVRRPARFTPGSSPFSSS